MAQRNPYPDQSVEEFIMRPLPPLPPEAYERHWIVESLASFFDSCLSPFISTYDAMKETYNVLSRRSQFIVNSALIMLIGCAMYSLYPIVLYNTPRVDIPKLFVLERDVMLPKKSYSSKKSTRNSVLCMMECLKTNTCFNGFFDYSLNENNCFLFTDPPAHRGHTPIWSPSSTIFLKKEKLEVKSAEVERAKEDGLYYYASPKTMKVSDMVDYCTRGNLFYYPAIMGQNNSAYEVARRTYAQLYPAGDTHSHHGLLFLVAVISLDSSSQIAKGYALLGQDDLLRDRLVRYIFYKDDMLEFLSEFSIDDEFHVLCQGDPFNMQGDDWLIRSLFFAITRY